jgi:hypothetical protein
MIMKIHQSLVAASLLLGMAVTPAIAQTTIQLEKTAPIEADAANPIDVTVQSAETQKILAAPGFSALQSDFSALFETATPDGANGKRAIPTPAELNLPIGVENFIYNQGGVGLASGLVNQQYFGHCFSGNYGVLGGSSDRVLPPPVRATADSGVSPFLSAEAIHRLQSLQVKFRYAFTGGYASSLSLYLVNLTTQQTQFVGTLPKTSNLHPRCATVNQDLTKYIKTPGVYGVRLVMVNRGFIRFPPYPMPPIGPFKPGQNPGDMIQLGATEPIMVEADSAIGVDASKFSRHRPFFPKTKAVAGFDHVVVKVQRK